jgi:2,3-bisphosphoglycerate-dependent phosphoglycerate mutase
VADLLCDYPITGIYASPFLRARQTIVPLADKLGLSVHIEPDLRERKLSGDPDVADFLAAVRRTWRDPSYAHPGGETHTIAQRRGVAVVRRLSARHPGEHLVLSTHGTLMALVLQYYDPGVDYAFWKALTMPDVYELRLARDQVSITRLWTGQGG